MTHAVVLGAGGQLGRALAVAAATTMRVSAWTRRDLDITDAAAVRRRLDAAAPDVIMNAAAWSQVDEAEADPVAVLAVNTSALRTLAREATERDCTLIHFSTDFVFDGVDPHLNDETTRPHPRGVYATSKLLGEWFAATTPRHYVLRVSSLFGGPTPHSSIDRMLAALRAGRAVQAFADRTVSPGFVDDIARATVALARGGAPFGLYHCVNSGHTTWLGIAEELARLTGSSTRLITPVDMAGLPMAALRPLHGAMSNAKLVAAGIPMPTWQHALARYVTTASS